MFYDSDRRRVVMFGGYAKTVIGDTWEWDGDAWTQVADIGPSARFHCAATYDKTRKAGLLFGGRKSVGSTPQNDTWTWDGEAWTQVDDTGPTARSEHALAFDGARGNVLLFGGSTESGTAGGGDAGLGDTWWWDGSSWTQVADTGPTARYGAAMAYDAISNCVVLFGGESMSGTGYAALRIRLDDTWAWNGTDWTRAGDIGPPARASFAMVDAGPHVVLHGGWAKAGLPRDTWGWHDGRWTERQDMGPNGRRWHVMAYDTARERVVLFGGYGVPGGNGFGVIALGDTWELKITG